VGVKFLGRDSFPQGFSKKRAPKALLEFPLTKGFFKNGRKFISKSLKGFNILIVMDVLEKAP